MPRKKQDIKYKKGTFEILNRLYAKPARALFFIEDLGLSSRVVYQRLAELIELRAVEECLIRDSRKNKVYKGFRITVQGKKLFQEIEKLEV